MKRNMSDRKKIVYWGTGNICSRCLEAHPEITPVFYIDKIKTGEYNGRPILTPQSIEDWSEIFVVITIKHFKDVKKVLDQFGLVEGVNYASYVDYFGLQFDNVTSSLQRCSSLPESNEGYTILLQEFELFRGRKVHERVGFYKTIRDCIGKDRFLMLAPIGMLSEDETYERYGIEVMQIPEMSIGENDGYATLEDLSVDDKNYIDEVASFKKCLVTDEIRRFRHVQYYWYKNLFKIINVKHIFYWGCWFEGYYYIRHLAQINRVNFSTMEYGWLPGTYCIDTKGSAGESCLMDTPEAIKSHSLKDRSKIDQIKKYVRDSRIDSSSFRQNAEDDEKLSHLDARPKILFIGMGEGGMSVKNGSSKWHEVISSTVDSTVDAINELCDICIRNEWNLIIKPHPEVSTFGAEIEEKNASIVFIKDKCIDDLINVADVIVSIVSSVELKALIYGKPVVQLGHSPFQYSGATYYTWERGNIVNMIKNALKYGMTDTQTEKFDTFLEFMLETYWYDDMTERPVRYGRRLET